MKSPTHSAALEYATKYGWAVFPLTPGGKEPLRGTRGHLDASTDPRQIDAWWTNAPDCNVGIAVAPSGLVVLDVDVGTKKDGTPKRGRESLAEIEGSLTPTLLAQTGRGGTHAVYVRPPDVPPARIIGFRDGLDLIGDGYIVAAPSFLAESGRHYQWTQPHAIAPLPPFLQHITRAPRVQEKVQALGTPIVEGSRNNALYKLGAALRDTGIGREALARALDAENRTRFTPPLPDPELVAIVDSVMRRVEVKRDVAAGAAVEQEIQAMFAPTRRSELLENVARIPQPPTTSYSTGFPELDELLGGGFTTQQLCGIIGPPSTGKSALVGHWLVALSQHRIVLHCSLELLRHELYVRYAAHKMEFPWRDGMKGKVDNAAMAAAVKGVNIRLIGAEDVDPTDPLGSILAEAEAIKQETGVAPIIAIDYIQLMARGQADQMRHRVGELTARCRRASQQLDTVVLGVFTTQRVSYSGKAAESLRAANDPTAYLGAAKESGDIEFDCATLMYLDVDKLHHGPEKPGRIAVARCRIGDVGFVGIMAKLDVGKFWGDPSVLQQFTAEALKAKKGEDSIADDCERLLAAITQLPNRNIAELRDKSRLSGAKWKAAVDKLKADGLICDDEIRVNGRLMPGKTLRRCNSVPPPTVAPEDDEP